MARMASQQLDAAGDWGLTFDMPPLTTLNETFIQRTPGQDDAPQPGLTKHKFWVVKGCDQKELLRLDCLNTVDTEGDTLIIVRFPTGKQKYVNCLGERWTTKEFFFESHKLLATGSTVFKKLLSPKAQAQAFRNNDSHPDLVAKAKFILDLTPKSEEIEAASLVIDLSLSQGVSDWWLSHDLAQAPDWLVSGHDDDCPRHDSIPGRCNHLPTSFGVDLSSSTAVDDLDIPPPRKISDYCPIRHRAAILRLLLAINDGEVVLNSAPRVATMAVIAKHFDCISVVQSQVLQWFLAEANGQWQYNNTDFIDINPEDTLKIGWLLQIPSLTRIAFRLLVVEKAVNVLATGVTGECGERQEIKLRCSRGTLTEEQQTCIEHAGRKLAERTASLWSDLTSTSPDLLQIFRPAGWKANPTDSNEKLLLGRIRDSIAKMLSLAFEAPPAGILAAKDEITQPYTTYSQFVSSSSIDAQLLSVQRVLTKSFWETFRDWSLPKLSSEELEISSGLSDLHRKLEMQELSYRFEKEIRNLAMRWIPPAPEIELPLQVNRLFVLSLSDEEFNFLPPWAGGLNDDAAQIFNPEVPPAESDFLTAPGPSVYIGQSMADYDDDDDDDGQSTIGPDTAITGTGTVTNGFSIRPAFSNTLSDFSGNQVTDYGLTYTIDPPILPSEEPSLGKEDSGTGDTDIDMLYYTDVENDWDDSDDQGASSGDEEATVDTGSTAQGGSTADVPIRSRHSHSLLST
ncbi:hypothetical protein GGR57DRAFT_103084 [Xylariaceae sp. FL1272]|nr:hypothetical protein GGR57DRAFT_103084 [Xylariaceae sp. FL1272]